MHGFTFKFLNVFDVLTIEIGLAKMKERRSQAKFAGRRYWKNNDPSVVLIYDVNGYVAGMQTAVSIIECDS